MGLGFLFPGQGAQMVGMGKDLHERFPYVRELYARASAVVGYDLGRLCFEGPREELSTTRVSQPAIFTTSVAAVEVLARESSLARGAFAAGLSLGEYTALYYARAISFEDAIALVEKRGRFMQEACDAVKGSMASVLGLTAAKAEEAVAAARGLGEIAVANYNAPEQVVIAGERSALDRACEKARELGARRVIPLDVAGAYHTRLMLAAADKLAPHLRATRFSAPAIRFFSSVTAREESDPERIQEILVQQVAGPVRWCQVVEEMARQGLSRAVEAGPGRVLAGLMRQIAPQLPVTSVGGIKDLEGLAVPA